MLIIGEKSYSLALIKKKKTKNIKKDKVSKKKLQRLSKVMIEKVMLW